MCTGEHSTGTRMALQEISLDSETNHYCPDFSFFSYPKFSISLLNIQLEWNHSQICLTAGFETFQKKIQSQI